MSDINAVLEKMGLTEDEANTFFAHFAPHFFTDHCMLNLSLDTESNWDYDSKYNTLSLKISLEYNDNILLETSTSCSISA